MVVRDEVGVIETKNIHVAEKTKMDVHDCKKRGIST
jgi:hypothetical protein